jgi:hypothetical protein
VSTYSDNFNTGPSSLLRAHSDDINTEMDTDLLKSTLRQSREPLRWEEQTVQKSRSNVRSINRASLNQSKSQQPSLNTSVGRSSMSRSIDKSPILWTIPSESDEPNILDCSAEKSDQALAQSALVSNFSNTNNIESRSLVIDVPDLNSESAPNSEEVSYFNSKKH